MALTGSDKFGLLQRIRSKTVSVVIPFIGHGMAGDIRRRCRIRTVSQARGIGQDDANLIIIGRIFRKNELFW